LCLLRVDRVLLAVVLLARVGLARVSLARVVLAEVLFVGSLMWLLARLLMRCRAVAVLTSLLVRCSRWAFSAARYRPRSADPDADRAATVRGADVPGSLDRLVGTRVAPSDPASR